LATLMKITGKKVGMVSLGCDKNRVDAEKMLARLSEAGFCITNSADNAEIIIVNTCAFIESAKRETINTILEMAAYKQNGICEKLIVTGCLSERYKDVLKSEIPEADAVVPLKENAKIVEIVFALYGQTYSGEKRDLQNRVLTTLPHYAYLKIADGCDNCCTFCAIPKIRGRYRSACIESLVQETKKLVADYGVRELILVAQDVTKYGIDLYGKSKLTDLVEELSKTDIEWIRLMYCYPESVSGELIDLIAGSPKVCKYIDIPLQHASNAVLRKMNRRFSFEDTNKLLKNIKSKNNEIAIRSTFLIGFPGETEEDFIQLKEFLKAGLIDHAGFFAFSAEEGTAAYNMKPTVKKSIVNERIKQLANVQRQVVITNNNRKIGKTVKVIYEGIDYKKQMFFGRTEQNAPDIDTVVYFTAKQPLDIGKFYDVKICAVDGYDLKGEVSNESAK